jgi:hypothetical protein
MPAYTLHSPPIALNVTGIERVSIRWLAAAIWRPLLQREPILVGQESSTAWLWDASRSYELFGPPSVSLDEMITATAQWHMLGGSVLGKPTHFEVRDGKY